MKKIISIILILVMCTGLVSCSKAPEEPEIVEYKGYYDPYLTELSPLHELLADKGYTKGSDLSFGDTRLTEADGSGAKKEIQFEYMGTEYTLKYTGNSVLSDYAECQNEKVRDDKILDTYNLYSEGEEFVLARVNRETEVVEFFYSYGFKYPVFGDFTLEDAEKKGEEYIKSIYGKNALDGYKINLSEYDKTDRTYHVSYRKAIDDVVASNDYITIEFDLEGNIVSFSASNYGYVHKVSDRITAQSIENAAAKIRADFGEEYSIKKGCFMLHSDSKTGMVYLGALVQSIERPSRMVTVYVNLFNY